MVRMAVRLPADLAVALDRAASQLRLSRAAVVRKAIENYLDDFEDMAAAMAALQDQADPTFDWASVRRDLRAQD
jgi:RHH-type transcriptional regulator, rel operon repressor / antitoxin RelB